MRSAMSSRLEPFNKFLQESTSHHWFCFIMVKHFSAAPITVALGQRHPSSANCTFGTRTDPLKRGGESLRNLRLSLTRLQEPPRLSNLSSIE
jgi:hypothetical protein